jgi:hypothetical protein
MKSNTSQGIRLTRSQPFGWHSIGDQGPESAAFASQHLSASKGEIYKLG